MGDFFAAFLAALAMFRGSCDKLDKGTKPKSGGIPGHPKTGPPIGSKVVAVILDRPLMTICVIATNGHISTFVKVVKRKFLIPKLFQEFQVS